jgi:transcriptional regulator with XRE-family HTH domain
MATGFDLKAARESKGLTLRAAAEEIGVSPKVLGRAEVGGGSRPGNLVRIADYYGRRPSELVRQEELMTVPRKDLEDLLQGLLNVQETLGHLRQGVEALEARVRSSEEELASAKAELVVAA